MIQEDEKFVKYGLSWHVNVVRLSKTGKRFLSLGVCENTNTISHMAVMNPNRPITEEFIKVLVVQNVYVEKGQCEDGKYCVNLECPFNRATPESFKKYGVKTREDLEKLHAALKNIQNKASLKFEGAGLSIYKKPLVYLSLKRK